MHFYGKQMSTYIFGDLHGCYDEFTALLKNISYNENEDELIFTGDLIGRGPKPVDTLNLITALKAKHPGRIHSVLGNHDLNFLAVFYGYHKAKAKDNLDVLLNAPKLNDYIEFFKSTPLLYVDPEKKIAVAHAGIYPKWTIDEAQKHTNVISKVLKDPLHTKVLLANMYADHPDHFEEQMLSSDLNYWRFIVSAFTRMRLCSKELVLDYGHSDCTVIDAQKDNIYPWFNFGSPFEYKGENFTLFFGHWAALNAQCDREHVVALDTGCVWGDRLSCYALEKQEKISVLSLQKKRESK